MRFLSRFQNWLIAQNKLVRQNLDDINSNLKFIPVALFLWNVLRDLTVPPVFAWSVYEISQGIYGVGKVVNLFPLITNWPFIFLWAICVLTWRLFGTLQPTSIRRKLRERDTHIEILVGDIFDQEGELVIPTNSSLSFSHGHRAVTMQSIEGKFIHHCFGGRYEELDQVLYEFYPAIFNGSDSTADKHPQDIGKVLSLDVPNQCKALLLVTSPLGATGNAVSHDENLGRALAGLWTHLIGENNTQRVVIPLISTGFASTTRTREEIIRTIVGSFITNCSERVFCNTLTIVIRPSDLDFINLKSIFHFLECKIQVTEFDAEPAAVVGTAV